MYTHDSPSSMNQVINVRRAQVPYGIHARRTVILASDHRGYALKQGLLDYLQTQGIRAGDIGTHSPARCDYPKFSSNLGRMISQDPMYDTVGIGICGSGIGIGIPASAWLGVYTARCLTPDEAKDSRRHTNSNLLCLGADVLDLDLAIAVTNAWLWEPFEVKEPYLSRFLQTAELEKLVYEVLASPSKKDTV